MSRARVCSGRASWLWGRATRLTSVQMLALAWTAAVVVAVAVAAAAVLYRHRRLLLTKNPAESSRLVRSGAHPPLLGHALNVELPW